MAVSVPGEICKHNALKRTTFAFSSTFRESLHSALLKCKPGSIYLIGKEARTELQKTGNHRTPISNALQGTMLQSPQDIGHPVASYPRIFPEKTGTRQCCGPPCTPNVSCTSIMVSTSNMTDNTQHCQLTR